MEFGEVPLDAGLGAILAHSEAVPGGRLRKGARLGAGEIAALRAAGLARVTVARPGPDDVGEDDAALALAQALVPEGSVGLRLRAAGAGRVNVMATGPGIVRVNAGRVDRINAVDAMLTLATVAPWQRMAPGGMVATVKVIAYAVAAGSLAAACAAGGGGGQGESRRSGAPVLALLPPVRRRVALIQTQTARGEDGGKGQRVTAMRVERLGGTLGPVTNVPHRVDALSDALRDVGDADLILILTASATSDWHDTAPQALREAGGTVEQFGMPVDPGNLLFLGRIGRVPVIGLPGCARSPALNGADWVLERVMCGQRVTARTIAAMGVGGLLKEIASRPRPREGG